MTLSGRLSSPFANSAGIGASTRSNVHVVPYSSGASLSIWLRSLLLRTATVRIRFFLRQAQASGPNRFVNRVCQHVNLFRYLGNRSPLTQQLFGAATHRPSISMPNCVAASKCLSALPSPRQDVIANDPHFVPPFHELLHWHEIFQSVHNITLQNFLRFARGRAGGSTPGFPEKTECVQKKRKTERVFY